MSTVLEQHWETELQSQRRRLLGRRYQLAVEELGYSSFQEWLKSENGRYRDQALTRYLTKLGPILEEFEVFVRSITTMVQGGGQIAGLVWGSIQAVLDAASKYAKLLESVTNMIEEISLLMPQLATYSTLFPGKKALDNCLRILISDFVGFCIEAVIFFKRWPIYSLLRIFWFSLERNFQAYKSNILRHQGQFDRERQVLVDTELIYGGRIRAVEAMIPITSSAAREPERLYIVPFQRNPRFQARGNTLSLLHQNLCEVTDDETIRQKSCVVHGGGGMGKTQLAIEYTHRYRRHFDYIVWICAESKTELTNGMAELAKRLKISDAQGATSRASIEAARTWLETTDKRWLLVFDNANRWEDLQGYWPFCASGSVLVTSQLARLRTMVSSEIRLSTLEPSEGARFLLDEIAGDGDPQTDMENARLISEALGGHPLSIVHVAGYIAQSHISLEAFLHLFENRQRIARILSQETTLLQYERNMEVVHDIALQELDAPSLMLAQILSMLCSEGVPREMLLVDADHGDRLLGFLEFDDEASFHEMIRQLRARHLIDCQGLDRNQLYLMHRSLQLSLLRKMDEEEGKIASIFNMAVSLTRRMFPRQSPVQFPQNDIWEKCEKYSPHVMSIMSAHAASPAPPECSIDYALLLSDVSNYFYERNIFGDALDTSNVSVKVCERFVGRHEAVRADIHTIAAAVRDTCGISERLRTLHHYVMTVALRQEYLNKSNPIDVSSNDLWNYANAWGNMTPILLDYECYEDVIIYSDLAITMKKKLLGSGQDCAIACYEPYRNKHIALAALGRLDEAQKWEPDPDNFMADPTYKVIMIRYYFFHANIAILCGNLDSAYTTLQMVLSMRTDIFGPTGRSTLDTYYLLAMLESKRHNNEAAEAYLRKALERPDQWTDEACARAKYQLARLLLRKKKDDKKDEEARNLLKEATQVRVARWEKYAGYWPLDVPLPDEDAIYDHIVPAEAGRLVMTKSLPANTLTRQLNDVCRHLESRLGSKDDILPPKDLAELLKTSGSLFHLVPHIQAYAV
ncbi:hypothetical protein THAR02_10491 [Trichoderma harzianum]|uniref:Uncharacterized protein n=1 Tax=Trichoderma harzianum TaxID=5544 RepID=A0A0F9ZWB1_TRIHA|nr:hypothetical protein THAR02_10491 [Trichoderma harzianum]